MVRQAPDRRGHRLLAFEPIKFVDDLVKGAILAFYNFARLSAASVAIPYVRKSRRFWPAVVRLTASISPLTFLFLWIFVGFSMLSSAPPVWSYVVGRDVSSDVRDTVFRVIANSLLLTIALDLIVRAGCLWIPMRTRRRLYEDLLRLSIAPVVMGFVASILLFGLFNAAELTHLFLVSILAGSVATVCLKLLRLNSLRDRLLLWALAMLIVPYGIMYTGVMMAFELQTTINRLIPSPMSKPYLRELTSYDIHCIPSDGALQVKGYLRTTGYPFVVLRPSDFQVYAMTGAGDDLQRAELGRPKDDGSDIAVSPGTPVRITLSLEPSPVIGARTPCRLDLMRDESSLLESRSIDLPPK